MIHILILLKQVQSQCRFASKYQLKDMFNETRLNSFLYQVYTWEKNFIRDVGVSPRSGMTFDGQRVDVLSGQLITGSKHEFTASSKQSLHIGIMAKVLEGQPRSSSIYSISQVMNLVAKKVYTYEDFNRRYPGFGGFMPWVNLSTPNVQPTWDFKNRTPSLDNGEMFWACVALSQAWKSKHSQLNQSLRQRWQNITWKLMLKNMRRIFYNETTGKIRAVSNIKDISKPPQLNYYWNDDDYYLDDPYEGELVVQAITLLSTDFSPAQIQRIWIDKRKKLKAVEYAIKSKQIKIKVQRGNWFSAHEQWKNIFLPYSLSPTYSKVFFNNQLARTWNSVQKGIPGLYASITGLASQNNQSLDYFADCGIPQISVCPVNHLNQITGYATFPLFLINKTVASVWLLNYLKMPAGQTKYGSIEGCQIQGQSVSPMLTWDSKITTILAIAQGTQSLIRQFLQEKGVLSKFIQIVERQYRLQFEPLQAVGLQLGMPQSIAGGRPDFSYCAATVQPN